MRNFAAASRALASFSAKALPKLFKHGQQWRNTLATHVNPVMGNLPVGDIATAQVLQILEPIWREKPETASRIRGRIETVLGAAKARGYRSGENPARSR